MIGFPHEGSAQYDFIRKQTKDRESKESFEFPVEYMFKDVPKGLSTDDPVSLVLQQMDRFGIPFAPQQVSRIDIVMFDFPDLVFVTRHGCEPWEDLAVKLMLKWPNLYYSTSAFAPKYYPKAIIDYANTRGADKVLYAGYFPMGLSLERIFNDLPKVPLKDEVWPKFLYGNAARILGIES
jgi:predicted TIM-barrel fold metal-dependent hydrolase